MRPVTSEGRFVWPDAVAASSTATFAASTLAFVAAAVSDVSIGVVSSAGVESVKEMVPNGSVGAGSVETFGSG
jgi:hypothetical protein